MTRKREKPNVKPAPPSLEDGARGTPVNSPLAAEPAAEADLGVRPKAGFPIVGIGASAGGLAAFEAFFSGMPADTDSGMAFVLVQHLAPDHKSILTELVKRYTQMQVFEVEDGMVVQPNCTYIIPPNRDMAFLAGTLQLLEPAAPRACDCRLTSSSDPWPRTSTSGRSASCFPAPAVTARWGCGRSRARAAWGWPRTPNPRSTMACRGARSPPGW